VSKLQKSGEETWFVVYQNLVVAPLLVKPQNDLFLNDPYSNFFVIVPLFSLDSQGTCCCQDRRKEVGIAVSSVE
jgi:hypothetical protein